MKSSAVQRASGSRRWLVLAVVVVAQLMDVMDATIVNIALPSAQADLGFSDGQRQWIVTAYALTFGALLLTGGRLTDRFGPKRTLLVGLAGFAVASAVGGAAPVFGVLVVTRALQGMFGALLAPAALSVLNLTFTEPGERRRAFGLFGGITGAAGAFGLLIGGILTEHLSWRWGMYVNVPIAVLAMVGATVLISSRSEVVRTRLNLPSAILAALGLGALVYGFDRAGSDGWDDPTALTLLLGAVAVLALFVVVQGRSDRPLLPLRIITNRERGAGLLLLGVAPIGMFAVFLFLVYYLQQILRFTPVQSGAAFLPMIVGIAGGAGLVSARVVQRVPTKVLFLVSALIGATGIMLLTRLSVTSDYFPDVVPALVIIGLGVGPIFPLGINIATVGVREEDAGVASAFVNALQQIGGALGVALLNAIATQSMTAHLTTTAPPTLTDVTTATIAGYGTAYVVAATILAAAGIAAAVVLPSGRRRRRPRTGAQPPAAPADAPTLY